MILAVCDYLSLHSNQTDCARQGSFTPLRDSAIAHAIRQVVLAGLSGHAGDFSVPREIVASTISWAIYAAAKDWFSSTNRKLGEEDISSLVRFLLPLIQASAVAAHSLPSPPSRHAGKNKIPAKQ
jgi:hypothetical protein